MRAPKVAPASPRTYQLLSSAAQEALGAIAEISAAAAAAVRMRDFILLLLPLDGACGGQIGIGPLWRFQRRPRPFNSVTQKSRVPRQSPPAIRQVAAPVAAQLAAP